MLTPLFPLVHRHVGQKGERFASVQLGDLHGEIGLGWFGGLAWCLLRGHDSLVAGQKRKKSEGREAPCCSNFELDLPVHVLPVHVLPVHVLPVHVLPVHVLPWEADV
jgi:hypothetical protein